MSLLSLLLSILFCCPQIVQLRMNHVTYPVTDHGNITLYYSETASLSEDWYNTYKWVRAILTNFVLLAVLLLLNIKTALAFRAQQNRRRQLVGQHQADANKDQKYLVVMLLCTCAVHVVCGVPSSLSFILHRVSKYELTYTRYTVAAVCNLAGILNSALNFYCYCSFSKYFRRDLRRALQCMKSQPGAQSRGWYQTRPSNGNTSFNGSSTHRLLSSKQSQTRASSLQQLGSLTKCQWSTTTVTDMETQFQ